MKRIDPESAANSAVSVTVVIVTHNGAQYIGACLESVFASAYPANVVVVDNASEDDTLSIVARFPEVVCLPQKKNRGFGVANNIGMRLALDEGAEFVFLLNQDAYVQPGAIGTLVRAAQEHPRFGILSPVHLDKMGLALDGLFAEFVRTAYPEKDVTLGALREEAMIAVPFVNAAAWLVKSECIRRVGGFDPIFFMRGEDNDYCNRARFHGFQVGLVPGAEVRHDRVERLESEGAGNRRSVKWRAGERKRQMIVALKDPGAGMVRHVLWWGWGVFTEGLKCIGKMDGGGFVALIMASVAVLCKLPAIRSHRRACIGGRMAWIESPGSAEPQDAKSLSGKRAQ